MPAAFTQTIDVLINNIVKGDEKLKKQITSVKPMEKVGKRMITTQANLNKKTGQWTKTVSVAQNKLKRFKMEFLSVMFFGMLLQRTFSRLLRSTVSTFTKIMEASGFLGTAIQRLGVHFEFLKFTVGSAINQFLEPLMPAILNIISLVNEWVQLHPKLTAGIILGGFALGLMLFLIGTLTLGIGGLIMAFTTVLPILAIVGGILLVLAVKFGLLDGFILKVKEGLTAIGVSSGEVEKIGDAMENTLPKVITFFTELISTVRDWIVNNLPILIQIGADMLISIIQGIANNIDKITEAITLVINTISKIISDNASLLIESAITILMAIINGITENITILTNAAMDITLALLKGITDNIDIILDAALQIVVALVKGIAENLPMFIDALLEILFGIIDWITSNPLEFAKVGLEMAIAIVAGLTEAIGRLVVGVILGVIESVVSGVKGAISLGKSILGFQHGGLVPNDGLFQLHQGERVVPAGQNTTNNMGGITVNITTTGGVNGSELASDLVREIKRHL